MNATQIGLYLTSAASFIGYLFKMLPEWLAYFQTEPAFTPPKPAPVVQILTPDSIEVPFMPAPLQPKVDPRIALLEQLFAFVDALEAAGKSDAAEKARAIWNDLKPEAPKKPE